MPFTPTSELYLTVGRRVNRSLFRNDDIHQNEEGYYRWTERLKEYIQREL